MDDLERARVWHEGYMAALADVSGAYKLGYGTGDWEGLAENEKRRYSRVAEYFGLVDRED